DQVDINKPDPHGRLPLHHACFSGNEAICRVLLPGTRLINLRDSNGYTPLHLAVMGTGDETAKQGVVTALFEDGPLDFLTESNDGKTVAVLAASQNLKVLELLVQLDPLILTHVPSNGFTALHGATYSLEEE